MARLVIACVLLAAAAGLLASGGDQAAIAETSETVKALYVFGDSYVDTGNTDPDYWSWPSGYTWPGHPKGRVSDGRVLSDFIACSLGVMSPMPFRTVNSTTDKGVNFAYAGSGVFTTGNGTVSDVTTQIQDLKDVIKSGYVPTEEFFESHVLFAIDGNDYYACLVGEINCSVPIWNLTKLPNKVVDQMGLDIETLLDLGFKNFSLTNIGPADLYPLTYDQCNNFGSSSTDCIEVVSLVVNLHNDLLKNKTEELAKNYPKSNLNILDLHEAFTTVLQEHKLFQGPCQTSVNNTIIVCDNVNNTLFWDGIHPTQAGWLALLKTILAANLTDCLNSQPAFAKM